MRRAIRRALIAVGALALGPALYLAAAALGAALPAPPQTGRAPGTPERIYLLTTLLHADIAVPLTPERRRRFGFLEADGLPLSSPSAKHLVFGWGSQAFYTATPRLADIRPGPLFAAITGDSAVMHVYLAGDLAAVRGVFAVDLPPGGTRRLLRFVETGFEEDETGPLHLAGAAYGQSDAFYAGTGHFNLWRPCNIWVAEALRAAGLSTGRWTPTTRGLLLGLRLHSPQAYAGMVGGSQP